MTFWQLETSPRFDKSARKLDPATLRRIRGYLDEVCELRDPRQRGKPLGAELAGYWRYRVGDYRIVVAIRDTRLIIVAIELGHRSEIYRDR
ncbi:MAG: type II toxin-antitoxin system RelE family toxin [Angustibacter sp.]